MTKNKITLLLVEDHNIVRKGLLALLDFEEDMQVIGEAENGLQAIELAKSLHPMIILMDIGMPKLNGIEASRQILKLFPKMKVLILSAHADDGYIEKCMEIGVHGFLIKQCSPHLLVEAIREIHQGKYVFSPTIKLRLDHLGQSEIDHQGVNKPKNQVLSQREIQVLQLIAEGQPNKLIAVILSISIKTVDKHRQNLMKKLSIHDTAGLTRYAISEGITECTLRQKNQ
jgi:DNA-binding NarL/FixJ family response regulator